MRRPANGGDPSEVSRPRDRFALGRRSRRSAGSEANSSSASQDGQQSSAAMSPHWQSPLNILVSPVALGQLESERRIAQPSRRLPGRRSPFGVLVASTPRARIDHNPSTTVSPPQHSADSGHYPSPSGSSSSPTSEGKDPAAGTVKTWYPGGQQMTPNATCANRRSPGHAQASGRVKRSLDAQP